MIYRAIQLIQIFLAHKQADERTKVFQEVLADLKSLDITESGRGIYLKQWPNGAVRAYQDVRVACRGQLHARANCGVTEACKGVAGV